MARPTPDEELDDQLVALLVAGDLREAEATHEAGGRAATPWTEPPVATLLDRAERHGVSNVAVDRLLAAGVPLGAEARRLEARATARALDHAAHLGLLRTIDGALGRARIEAAALKGPLLAERLYATPSARSTSDVDLLVAEADLDAAVGALATAGYHASTAPEEERFRREHHHLHLGHPAGPPLELHFHAYRGFGGVLRSEPLLARRQAAPAHVGLSSIGVLEPADEIVYLAVHAAAHRFVRLGWLYDLYLLVESVGDDTLDSAALRAEASGFARQVAWAAALLRRWFVGNTTGLARLDRLGRLHPTRARVIAATMPEPANPIARTTTRMVYSLALCQDAPRATRYFVETTRSRVRQLLRR